jgi:ABC-type multidrug transport system ATPase subunit
MFIQNFSISSSSTKGVKGDLSINGKSLNRKSRKLCSYILQDDNLLPNFTILESMTMAANLKISNKSMNRHDKQTLVSR